MKEEPEIDLAKTTALEVPIPPVELQETMRQVRAMLALRLARNVSEPSLLIMASDALPRWVPLRPPVCSLGRDPVSDICVSSALISRHHMVFSWDQGLWRVEDAGSRNGLYFQDERISGRTLRSGDMLRAGDVNLLFVDTSAVSAEFE